MADGTGSETAVTEDGQKRAPKPTEKALETKLHKQINVRKHKLGQLTAKSKEIERFMEDDSGMTLLEQMHLPMLKPCLTNLLRPMMQFCKFLIKMNTVQIGNIGISQN